MTKDDYVIICGDFGGLWTFEEESSREKDVLDWLNNKNFTTLFVDGNHENYTRWYFGHYHDNRQVDNQFVLLYEDIVPLEIEASKLNDETIKAIEDAEKGIGLSKGYTDIDEMMRDLELPERVMIKSKKDLKEKLQKGIDDINNNRVYSLEEAFDEIDEI